jgi:L-alanine-DL-glutamate epimerase-like enolase superfamily enzyme
LGLLTSSRHLAVDANGALPLPRAMDYAKRLAAYDLRWFEEPCAPQAFSEFAELAAIYAPPLATGENLFCRADVQNLLDFAGFRPAQDILQVDPPQAYGIAAFADMVALLEARGGKRDLVFPHGGNMMSFAVTAGLGLGSCEAYPGVFGAFGGYADGMRVTDGSLNLPDLPGIGFEGQPKLFALMQELSA